MKKPEIVLTSMLTVIVCLLAAFFISLKDVNVKVDGNFEVENNAVAVVAPTQTPSQAPSQAPSQTPSEAPSQAPSETPDAAPSESAPQSTDGLPSTNAEILAKYTEILDKAKTDAPGYTKVEFQAIPEDKVNFDGKAFNTILPLATKFMKTEEDAKASPEVIEKGSNMYWFPLCRTTKGCLLTDASAIKSASCTALPDGNVKIQIVLNDEANSEPAAENATSWNSTIGSMFNPIMRADIDNTLLNDPAVKAVIRDLVFDLNYYDCTADLVYNPSNNQIVTLDQYMHILLNISSGKVLILSATGTAVIDNTIHISDLKY